MVHRTQQRDRQRSRRAMVIALVLALGGGLAGLAYAQSGISLNAPVSFPVDI